MSEIDKVFAQIKLDINQTSERMVAELTNFLAGEISHRYNAPAVINRYDPSDENPLSGKAPISPRDIADEVEQTIDGQRASISIPADMELDAQYYEKLTQGGVWGYTWAKHVAVPDGFKQMLKTHIKTSGFTI